MTVCEMERPSCNKEKNRFLKCSLPLEGEMRVVVFLGIAKWKYRLNLLQFRWWVHSSSYSKRLHPPRCTPDRFFILSIVVCQNHTDDNHYWSTWLKSNLSCLRNSSEPYLRPLRFLTWRKKTQCVWHILIDYHYSQKKSLTR